MDYTRKISMNEWKADDRPDTKLMIKGNSALSDAELLAVIMGKRRTDGHDSLEIARKLLSDSNNNLTGVAKMSHSELSKYVSTSIATRLICSFELGKRRIDHSPDYRIKVTSSYHAYELLRPKLQDKHYEEFWIVLLNRNNTMISVEKISEGGLTGTVVDPRKVFKIALDKHASNLILGHNHPSGNLSPSENDLRLTQKMVEAGLLLDISILDHLILTDNGYYSLSDHNEMYTVKNQ